MNGSARCRAITLTLCYALAATIVIDRCAQAQYPTQTSGTLTSPEVGDVEGIQRFGERLRTNPDPGIGYTYRVLPPVGSRDMDSQSMVWALAHLQEALQLKQAYATLANQQLDRQKATTDEEAQRLDAQIEVTRAEIARLNLILQLALGNNRSHQVSRYAPGFNPTAGLRSSTQLSPALNDMSTVSATNSLPAGPGGFGVLGMSQNGTLFSGPVASEIEIVHQPLIQIKVRIVEATRLNSAGFRSVLDYVSQNGSASLVKANNINGNNRSLRGSTRLPNPPGALRESATTGEFGQLGKVSGSGTLVNLSSEHINFITNTLVTEFSGDVLTVPEVVTLNGQNVEFVAGDNRPLPLGLTLVQSTGNVRQDVFYKHIGTLMSITPRIVNWGKYLEGAGEAPVVAQEISNWNSLAAWMIDERNILITTAGADPAENNKFKARLASYAKASVPVPIEDKIAMLNQLEKYSAKVIRERLWHFDQSILRCPTGLACDWKPEDCTIDLEVLVRESQIQSNATEGANSISNVVQVKSGNGVVMGGLIGTREIESVSKIPLLGDLPVVGYFFRSTSVDRAKTELIILIEATVLPNTEMVREQTAQDFRLGHDYVSGALRENPLEVGMYRAGFGQYLPNAGPHEHEYWARHGNKMRKVATEVDDLFR